MKKISSFITEINTDYRRKTALFSAFSACLTLFFAFFHAFFGVVFSSLWHGSISVYYLVLSVIRMILVLRGSVKDEEEKKAKIYVFIHILLLLLNISLVVPIAVMIRGGRPFSYGLIPAITMAVYTTYRVSAAVINLIKAKGSESRVVKTLRTVNFLDSFLSVLTLQNAMIAANGGIDESMHVLMIYTSSFIWLFMLFISIRSFRKITVK